MAKLRGGIYGVSFDFNLDNASYGIVLGGVWIAGEGLELPEPQVQTVQLADGRNVAVGYTVRFALRVKEISQSMLQMLRDVATNEIPVAVSFYSADTDEQYGIPRYAFIIPDARLTRLTDFALTNYPGLCAAIIEGEASGLKESDVLIVVPLP